MTQPWSFLHVCDLQPGSRRSFRFNPAQNENGMTAYRQMGKIEGIDLLLVGGDLTRDGSIHDFEFEEAKAKLDALPFPYYAIPGNMDTGNKHSTVRGATGRDDPRLNVPAGPLDRFAKFFGEFPWSFKHKNVRFSGFYAALAGSGLSYEDRMWDWLENDLPNLEPADHHVMNMHYTLFVDDLNEPNWDITKEDEYQKWYFSIDQPCMQITELDIHNAANMLATEWMEDDNIINSVNELWAEILRNDFHDRTLHCLIVFLAPKVLDHLRTKIRCHDNYRIAKVDGASLSIGQSTVIKYL